MVTPAGSGGEGLLVQSMDQPIAAKIAEHPSLIIKPQPGTLA